MPHICKTVCSESHLELRSNLRKEQCTKKPISNGKSCNEDGLCRIGPWILSRLYPKLHKKPRIHGVHLKAKMLGAMLDDVEIRAFCFSPVTVDTYEHILTRVLAVVFSIISSSSNSFVMISKVHPLRGEWV